MTKRLAVALGAALALAACGGNGAGGNAALGRSFSYVGAQPATSTQTSALGASVTSAVSLQSGPTSASAQGLSADDVASTLLGSTTGAAPTVPVALQQRLQQRASALTALPVGLGAAMPGAGFDDPACVQQTATSISFDRCTMTVTDTTSTSKVEVRGGASFDPAQGRAAWDYQVVDSTSFPADGTTMAFQVHEAGDLSVTATTLVGQMTASAGFEVRAPTGSMSVGADEAVVLDVGFVDAGACSTRVTSGSIEAKRVWTNRGGAGAAQLPDRAAKVTWTACGAGTIAFSQ